MWHSKGLGTLICASQDPEASLHHCFPFVPAHRCQVLQIASALSVGRIFPGWEAWNPTHPVFGNTSVGMYYSMHSLAPHTCSLHNLSAQCCPICHIALRTTELNERDKKKVHTQLSESTGSATQ